MRSIADRVRAASAVIVAGLLVFCGFLFVQLNHQIALSRDADKARDRQQAMAELSLTAKQMQIDIVQVQQFLTDISATRGLDGLDDGPGEAAKNAADFKAQIAKAHTQAADLHLDDITAKLDAVEAAFPAYYETGQAMARTYQQTGTEAGNAFMPTFDSTSENLYDKLQAATGLIAAKSAAVSEDADRAAIASTKSAEAARMLTLISGLLLTALIAGYALYILQTVVRPLGGFAAFLAAMSGNFTRAEAPYMSRRDEVGEVARAIEAFRLSRIAQEDAEASETDARVQRRQRRERLEGAIAGFRHEVQDALDALDRGTGQMSEVSHGLAVISDETTVQAREAAAATQEASANVQVVAAAAEELAASIADIGHKISMSRTVVQEAGTVTADSQQNIAKLADASNRIGDVVGLIRSIASQTNLLALNATIEAARAGEAGKGFAVVASEVKALADQTAKATHEIASQIENIQSETQIAVDSIGAVAARMDVVEEYSVAIATAVEEQSRATHDIAMNVAQAAHCTANAQLNVAQMDVASQKTSASAVQVRESTERLASQKGALTSAVETFLKEVAM